jgi:hypothetical protein
MLNHPRARQRDQRTRLQYSHTLYATALKPKQRMQFTMDSSVFHVAVAELMLIRL